MPMARLVASAVWLLILIAPPAFADFSGKVVAVHDGDTITVLHNGRGEKIRLRGIDCPEKGQPFGNPPWEWRKRTPFQKMQFKRSDRRVTLNP